MTHKIGIKQVIPIIKESVSTLCTKNVVLLPFVTAAFIQLFVLEILYFAPRYPLVKFFGPLIANRWGELYLHFPFNFHILPILFRYVQMPIYLFISSFLIATAIAIIGDLNNDREASFKSGAKQALKQYVHVVLAAALAYAVFAGLSQLYGLAIARAQLIRSQSGAFFMLKSFIIDGAPYFTVLMGVFVTTLFAYLLPVIIIENKKIFSAIILSFKSLWKSFWFTMLLVLIPTLFYFPVLLLRNNIAGFADNVLPGIRWVVLILSALVMIAIDATVYTAVTTTYLLKKENA